MVGNPDIIILDEPTAGLDVESRVVLHDEIKILNKKGKTIIIASHDMAEVESLADRISILKDGELIFVGPPDELMMKIKSTYEILIKFSAPFKFDSLSISSYQETNQGYATFLTSSIEEGLLELLTLAKKNNVKVYDLKIKDTSLEQRFMEIAKQVK